jgi:hypothetical protein
MIPPPRNGRTRGFRGYIRLLWITLFFADLQGSCPATLALRTGYAGLSAGNFFCVEYGTEKALKIQDLFLIRRGAPFGAAAFFPLKIRSSHISQELAHHPVEPRGAGLHNTVMATWKGQNLYRGFCDRNFCFALFTGGHAPGLQFWKDSGGLEGSRGVSWEKGMISGSTASSPSAVSGEGSGEA